MGMMGYADSDHGHGILKDRRSTICLDNEKGNHTMSIGQSVSKHRFACVTAVCAIAAACGSFALGVGRSIWFDEGYTLIVESQPFARMMDLLKVDVHPPLYYSDVDGSAPFHGLRAPCPVGFAVCDVRAADASVRV